MKVYTWQEITADTFNFTQQGFAHSNNGSSLTIGAFDGPHLGHKALFDTVLSKQNLVHGIVTFARSPRAHNSSDIFEGDVSTLRLRLESFKDFGFDYAVVIDFSADFGKIEGSVFLSILQKALSMKFFAVGFGFRCGNNLDTGTDELADFASKQNINFICVDLFLYEGRPISSTYIRQIIAQGNVINAEKLLGFPYRIDVSCLEQKKTKEGFTCAKSTINQIVPPVGQYKVCFQTEESSEKGVPLSYSGTVIVEEGILRCLIPHLDNGQFVQTIIFVNPEGKNRKEAWAFKE